MACPDLINASDVPGNHVPGDELAAPVDASSPRPFGMARTRFSVSGVACEDGVFDLKAP
jgi:hypothetical protein